MANAFGIHVGDDIHLGFRQARSNAHLLDHVVELANFQGPVVGCGIGDGALDRHRARRQQHGAIARVVAGQRADAAGAERRKTAEWKREFAVSNVEHVEAQSEKQQKPHEYNHDRPGAATVRGLLFEEIARQTYFLIERSTAGTCRSAASAISNSSDGLKPSVDANRLDGNVCCDVLNFVAMSL